MIGDRAKGVTYLSFIAETTFIFLNNKITLFGNRVIVFYHFFDQVDGESAISKGKISSRPNNIAKERTIFEISEYSAKFNDGPTKLKPGPTLLKQVAAAEKFVSKSNGSKHRIKKVANMPTM